ncbi:DUF2147 domain-containing protein [Aquimarina agarilytica]|uniref:DUF2147 domain-containing protein n=1 Tax=Aquimarina agarilytica TaxID=1087449 RepID=UPI000288B19C|nr:DUF2147 domain-containing protein [Aquimarina agarilytica]
MKIWSVLGLLFWTTISFSQQLEGQWETYDDKTGEKRSVVEIFKQNDQYFGKIIQKEEGTPDDVCDQCEGDKKDQKILGMVIIEGLEKDGDAYDGGTITDPESGNVYKCYLELVEKNKLKVRGYIGFSLLGRTQYWLRKQ